MPVAIDITVKEKLTNDHVMCFYQFGAETQQSKVAPSAAATRPIMANRGEQVCVCLWISEPTPEQPQ